MSLPIPVMYGEITALCRKHERLNSFELEPKESTSPSELFVYLLKLRNADTDLTYMRGLSRARMMDANYRRERMAKVSAVVSDQIIVLTNLKRKLES